jgi:hypothetical protein
MEAPIDENDILNKKPKKIIDKIKEKILAFDIYAQPLNLTYQKKSSFKSSYGIFFSFLTLLFCVIIIVDSVVFYKPKNTCQYSQIDDSVQTNYEINLENQFFLFFAVFDKSKV